MNLERNSGKRPMLERKNNRGGGSSSNSKKLVPPRFRINTTDYTHEELDEEVEINKEDAETPTPTSPATELPKQDEVPSLPTFSKTVVHVKRSLEKTTVTCTKCKLIIKHVTTGTQVNKEFACLDDIERANRNGIPIPENSMGVGGSTMVQSVLNMTSPVS
ncbi:hypothetical protein H5410_041737 [Solanum commersonii]|uniref:Uncharacterized protein n=1 Tax=Solanum commersonii TaxID=4109 RepID=A0A9J5XUE8_SOLCO|nr:hypothetical protein H5410_041737 [Solanum commersonii]